MGRLWSVLGVISPMLRAWFFVPLQCVRMCWMTQASYNVVVSAPAPQADYGKMCLVAPPTLFVFIPSHKEMQHRMEFHQQKNASFAASAEEKARQSKFQRALSYNHHYPMEGRPDRSSSSPVRTCIVKWIWSIFFAKFMVRLRVCRVN